jgi:uncharacterized protein
MHRGQSELRKEMIHAFSSRGLNIVLDVESGLVHVMDELAFLVVGMFESHSREQIVEIISGDKYSAADIGEAYDEIAQLQAAGDLFSDPAELPAYTTVGTRGIVKALCLHITHDCNLSCAYCFAGAGRYHGRREWMSAQTAKGALDFLVAHSGHIRNLEVDFFGGEPLLNFGVVKEAVAYGRELERHNDKHFRFTLTTNAVTLTQEIADFCNEQISNVVLSLDGRKETNDAKRMFPNGAGSYDVIVPHIRRFVKSRSANVGFTDYYVRGTYTHDNLDFSADVRHIAELDMKNISVEPVVAPAHEPYAIKAEDIPYLLEQYDALAEYVLNRHEDGKPINFFHFMLDLDGGPCINKRVQGCGAGSQYLAVTPVGDLYPCHQFVGDESFLLGNIADGITNTDCAERFASVSLYTKPACMNCFAKYFCSGGCAANAYHASGNILGDYEIGCTLQRKRVECAIMIQATLDSMDAHKEAVTL